MNKHTEYYMQEYCTFFKRTLIGAWRYAYFAPVTALWLTYQRGGLYTTHFAALHRLAHWHKYTQDLYEKPPLRTHNAFN